jgi:UDP-glucose 4-epimerase
LIEDHEVEAIIHFAGSTIVPDSMKNPLGYYGNNTANSRALIESAVKGGVRHFIFSSTAAVYGNPARVPVAEDDPTSPLSPYGWSKLMTEVMLRDTSAAHDLTHVALRYFNVAGADPRMRTGLSTPGATHLIKVAVEAALGRRSRIDVYGTDYPTPDGTTLNCGYGRGYSVREVLDTVRCAVGHPFAVNFGARRPGDIAVSVAAANRIRELLNWTPEFDDLDAIVGHALTWERHLMAQAEPRIRAAISA